MIRSARALMICCLLLVIGAALRGPLMGKDPVIETREFNIRVDGKHAGDYRMTIRDEDGSVTLAAQADVRFRYFLYNYVYQYRGNEVWKDGKLQRLDSNTKDDKKQFQVTAWSDGQTLHIKSNGEERTTRPDVWTSTYWRLPDARFRTQPVPLIDVDTGKDVRAALHYVGINSVNVNGQALNCTHYRVSGAVQVELWYDSYDRLVRQESIEEGHRTLLELARITR